MKYRNFLEELKECMLRLGIQKSNALYVASDMTRILVIAKKKYGVESTREMDAFLSEFTDLLQEIVGKTGTLLFPVFSWEFCKGKPFDRRNTLGKVGVMNNWILKKRRDFQRTSHPMYSFMVWGKDANKLVAMENMDAWGMDSPFAWLHKKGGKMLLLDVSLQRGFTFLHYVERCAAVPYRYTKAFYGEYVDSDGMKSRRSYTMYVRDLSIVSEEYLPDIFLENSGSMRGESYDGLTIKAIDLKSAYDVVYQDLRYHNGEHCYRFTDYVIDWEKGATHEDDLGDGLS